MIRMYMLLCFTVAVGIFVNHQPVKGDHSSLFGLTARNLIIKETIEVCSHYPNATEIAISVINSALHDRGKYTKSQVFQFKDGEPLTTCSRGTSDKISSVVVLAIRNQVNINGMLYGCGDEELGCVPLYHTVLQNTDRNTCTFKGQIPVLIKTAQSNPSIASFQKSVDNLPLSSPLFEGLVAVIAHELGHVLGLAHHGDTENEREGCVGGLPEVPPVASTSNCLGPALMFSPIDHNSCGILVFTKNLAGGGYSHKIPSTYHQFTRYALASG